MTRQTVLSSPACIGPVALRDADAVRRDIANFSDALAGRTFTEAFLSAVSPGKIAMYMTNRCYDTEEAYRYAIADAVRDEYAAIIDAGFLLHIDAPDLTRRYDRSPDLPLTEIKDTERQVEVLNYALRDLPPDRMRLHICWGDGKGPHHRDTELRRIVHAILAARPDGLLVEGATPRHALEWQVFGEVALPEGKVVIPGLVDSVTRFIEHPGLVAQRLRRCCSLVGRENVIAGTDCGFATVVGFVRVLPRIAWVKLRSMVDRARLASDALWRTHASKLAVRA